MDEHVVGQHCIFERETLAAANRSIVLGEFGSVLHRHGEFYS